MTPRPTTAARPAPSRDLLSDVLDGLERAAALQAQLLRQQINHRQQQR